MARIILLILGLSGMLHAQDVSLGLRVLDVSDDRPLAYVSVQLLPDGPSGITDDDGELLLKVAPGTYTLRASYTGYTSFSERLVITEDLEATLRLEASAELLQTVTVTDQNARQRLVRAELGVERLGAEELKSLPNVLGELDVLRSIQLMPGVSSAGEASNGFSVRGGTLDQNLILMDGAPVFTPTHLFGLFTIFTPDAIGTVDLYRGSMPARFGGRTASVLNVASKNPNTETTEIRGGVGLVSSNLSLDTPLGGNGKWGLLLAGRGAFNDFIFPLIRRLKETESRFVDGTFRLNFRPNARNLVALTGFYASDFYQVDLLTNFGGVVAEANQYDYFTLNGGLSWTHLLNDIVSLKLSANRADYRPGLRFPQLDGNTIEFRSAIRDVRGTAAVGLENEAHTATAGMQFVSYTVDPGELDPNGAQTVNPVVLATESGYEIAVFAEDEWRLSDRLTLTAGLRYVSYEAGEAEELVSYSGLEPRLGLSFRPREALAIKLAYTRSRQYLHNIFNATTPLPTSRWKVSDAAVGPQSSSLFSVGLSRLLEAYELRGELYYRDIDQLVEYRPGADFFLSTDVASQLLRGDGRAYGLELTARRRTGRLTGEVNYAFARVENRVQGREFSERINGGEWYPGYFDQPHTFSANLTLDEGKTHELGFNFVVQSNRPYTLPNGFVEVNDIPVPLFLERNNGRLPVYHRLDFSWTIHNLKRRVRRWTGDWVFTVYNVYGRDNAYNIYYQPKDANTPPLGLFSGSPFAAYRLSIFGAPIISLAYKFTFRP